MCLLTLEAKRTNRFFAGFQLRGEASRALALSRSLVTLANLVFFHQKLAVIWVICELVGRSPKVLELMRVDALCPVMF